MNGLDIFLVLLGGYTLLRGAFRGLVREISSICGLVSGFWAAQTYYPLLAQHLLHIIPGQEYANIVSYAVLFILVLLIFLLIGTALHRLLQALMLGCLDRLAGALLGLGKGLILGCLVFLALSFFLPRDAEILSESRLAPYLGLVLKKAQILVPEEVQDLLQGSGLKMQGLLQEQPLPGAHVKRSLSLVSSESESGIAGN